MHFSSSSLKILSQTFNVHRPCNLRSPTKNRSHYIFIFFDIGYYQVERIVIKRQLTTYLTSTGTQTDTNYTLLHFLRYFKYFFDKNSIKIALCATNKKQIHLLSSRIHSAGYKRREEVPFSIVFFDISTQNVPLRKSEFIIYIFL